MICLVPVLPPEIITACSGVNCLVAIMSPHRFEHMSRWCHSTMSKGYFLKHFNNTTLCGPHAHQTWPEAKNNQKQGGGPESPFSGPPLVRFWPSLAMPLLRVICLSIAIFQPFLGNFDTFCFSMVHNHLLPNQTTGSPKAH